MSGQGSHHWGHLFERTRRGQDTAVLEVVSRRRSWRTLGVIATPLIGLLAYRLVAGVEPVALPVEGKLMLAIFGVAAWLWVTGLIPPFATGVLVMGLLVFLLGVPATRAHEGDAGGGSAIEGWQDFIDPAAAPVVVLMLGGFVLGAMAHKHGVDRVLAVALLRPFGARTGMVVLGVMVVTATLSMWMSNTATAAMMMTMVAPLAAHARGRRRTQRALVLAVPVAANVGGIGTPIGTPPNAIAFGALRGLGSDITFLGWMSFALPVVAAALAVGWWVLTRGIRQEGARLEIDWHAQLHDERVGDWRHPGWRQWVVYGTFGLTVGLWMTSEWTHLPIAPIALIPIVVFSVTGLMAREDVNSLDWDILLLIAGGLALGAGMERSGLASWMISLLPLGGLSAIVVCPILCAGTLVLSTFMSNTGVSNLMMPLALGIAGVGASAEGTGTAARALAGLSPEQAAVAVALGASFAMSLPVSTPPNAIAFATGRAGTQDFVRTGVVLGVLGLGLTIGVCAAIG